MIPHFVHIAGHLKTGANGSLSKKTPIPCATWIKTGALKPGKLGLSCKANPCSDAGTGDTRNIKNDYTIKETWETTLREDFEPLSSERVTVSVERGLDENVESTHPG